MIVCLETTKNSIYNGLCFPFLAIEMQFTGKEKVWFDGIYVGHSMPNPVFTYILNICFVKTFCRYTIKGSNSSLSNYSI